MNPISLPLLFSLLLLLPSISPAGEASELIEMLNQDIRQSRSDTEKGTLHVYRARQYFKIKEWEKAEEDYNKALKLNHKGWVHMERGHFYMTRKKYNQAYDDARAAKKEDSGLSHEADKVIELAGTEIRKQYEADNPQTIIMDSKADRSRKTRFDVMRTQGVSLVSTGKNTAARQQRTAVRQQRTIASRAPVRSRG